MSNTEKIPRLEHLEIEMHLTLRPFNIFWSYHSFGERVVTDVDRKKGITLYITYHPFKPKIKAYN